MLTCHACMRRCLLTLIGDSSLVSTRGFAHTATPRREDHNSEIRRHSRAPRTSPTRQQPNFRTFKPDNAVKRGNAFNSGAISTSYNRQKWLESRGVTPIHKKRERQHDDDRIKNKLRYLSDPLKLAEHVRGILRDDDFESAVAVVRTASKDTQCVVSWNHLIDWQLSRGKMNGALKTYNEMKKRAQTPDAYTYTILFRGCSEHPMPNQALSKVLTVYNSMLSENAPVKPNTIHLNAVLKMCAKAQDMDALFSIAGSMPTKGLRAPNNMTFTIILSAIRINAFVDLRGDLTPVQERKNRQKAGRDARLLWQDVTTRWLQRDIIIDEELICTMGRVLLLGTNDDIDDIMSLVEQTMNIPRQAPSQSGREREPSTLGSRQNIGQLALARPEQNEDFASESGHIGAVVGDTSTPVKSRVEELSISTVNPFTKVSPPKEVKKAVAFFPRPGQNTLSLLMAAALDLRSKAVASKYWVIFTRDYQVDPDADNYHGYLRVLRQARASTETVELLLQMPGSYMAVKTFRIAMSTCGRDKNNQHSFSNAGKILDIMQSKLSVPDTTVLSTYLDIACSPIIYAEQGSPTRHDPNQAAQKGRQILRALHRLGPSYTNLRGLFTYGETAARGTQTQKALIMSDLLQLTQRMISAYDILMNRSLVDKATYQDLTKERSKLAAFITRYRHQKNALEGSSFSRDAYIESSGRGEEPSAKAMG